MSRPDPSVAFGAPLHSPAPGAGRPRPVFTPLRIVLVYAVLGVAWILFSDRLVAAGFPDAAAQARVQTVKGWLFVLATAGVLWALMRRQLAERQVLDAEVRAVLDGMADAVLVIGPGGAVVDVNAAAVTLLGARDRSELLLPLPQLLDRLHLRHGDGRPVLPATSASARALRGETVLSYDALARRLDGLELFLSISSAPVRGRRGAPSLAVTVFRDVSEVKRFEETREEFLATAAHEFKTPLAVIKAHAQLMQHRASGDPAALAVIDRQIDRLTRMVQQLLEVSRFRVGNAELRHERFELAPLLAEVAADVGAAERRDIRVEPPREAAVVLADRARIRQVIASLLENAVRFSPAGGEVEARVACDGGEAVLSVRDHGIGIAPERQPRLFEHFYRAHTGTPHDYGGLALGLGMSREIVTRHGGRIWFESEVGRGSTFFFSLPIAPEAPA